MSKQVVLPSYQQVADALHLLDAPAAPAEAHGLMCALVCLGRRIDGMAVVQPFIAGSAGPAAAELEPKDLAANRRVLLDLYAVTSHQLEQFEFDFHLLLPDDGATLNEQAEAFSQWCQGFLIGLKLADIGLEEGQSEEICDALQRFMEIASIDHEQLEVEHDDEKAFLEVTEYVRLAVLMIYSELVVESESQLATPETGLH